MTSRNAAPLINKLKQQKVLRIKAKEMVSDDKESKNQQPNDEINFKKCF